MPFKSSFTWFHLDDLTSTFVPAVVWQQIANSIDMSLATGIFVVALLKEFSTNGFDVSGC